jgi:parallel beta-helix repeat protein
MQKKVILGLVVGILAVSLIAGFIFAEPNPSGQLSLQSIFIRQDGSVYPSNVPIQRNGEVYTFTDSIYGTVKIQKSNIVLNGAGYTLSGPYNGSQANVWAVGDGPNQSPDLVAQYIIGIDLGAETVDGVTIQNLNVKNFSIGMYMWTKNNTVTNNAVSESILGIMLSGTNTTITNNYLADNKQGLFFGFNGEDALIPSDIIISHNGFDGNEVQINGCFCEDYPENEEPHSWDDGREGNYWSDYNGTDVNNDGVGDTPYVVDIQNQDRYPLVQNPVETVVPAQKIPTESIVLVVSVAIIIVAAAFAFTRQRKKHRPA